PASITVTGTTSPFSSKSCVMPILRPIKPSISVQSFHEGALATRYARPARSRRSEFPVLRLDLDVDTRGDVELLQRFHGLARGARDVDEPLVDADLELLARLLVHVRAAEHGVHGLRGRQRH